MTGGDTQSVANAAQVGKQLLRITI
ncbi:hypothetical protein [Escherichia coli]